MASDDVGLFGLTATIALGLAPAIVVAAEYLTIEAAQREYFPDAAEFEPLVLTLTSEQRAAVARLAGPQPPHGTMRVWRAVNDGKTLGYVFFDEVIGRSDFISYATAIDAQGRLKAIEILAYRESHGGEIRNAAWREQFADKGDLGQLKFRSNIKNISGATLSSEHVTQGVRWLFALWQTVLRERAAP